MVVDLSREPIGEYVRALLSQEYVPGAREKRKGLYEQLKKAFLKNLIIEKEKGLLADERLTRTDYAVLENLAEGAADVGIATVPQSYELFLLEQLAARYALDNLDDEKKNYQAEMPEGQEINERAFEMVAKALEKNVRSLVDEAREKNIMLPPKRSKKSEGLMERLREYELVESENLVPTSREKMGVAVAAYLVGEINKRERETVVNFPEMYGKLGVGGSIRDLSEIFTALREYAVVPDEYKDLEEAVEATGRRKDYLDEKLEGMCRIQMPKDIEIRRKLHKLLDKWQTDYNNTEDPDSLKTYRNAFVEHLRRNKKKKVNLMAVSESVAEDYPGLELSEKDFKGIIEEIRGFAEKTNVPFRKRFKERWKTRWNNFKAFWDEKGYIPFYREVPYLA